MKITLIIASLIILVTSCNFEYSEGNTNESYADSLKNEIKNDVELFESGLSCEKSFMSNDEGEFKLNTTFGENIQMNFVQLEGLEIVDNAIRVDIMFLFRSLEGDTLLFFDYGDINEQDFEVPDKDKIDFNVYTPITSPIWSNNKYLFKGGFKDVRTGKFIEGETTLKVNPNYDIDITEKGLTYSEIYLFDATANKFIVDQVIDRNNTNQLRIREINGFNLIKDNAMIGASLLLINGVGQKVLEIEDLGAEMKEGMPWEKIKDMLTIDFTLAEGSDSEFLDIEVKVWDKNGEGTLNINTRVTVK
jgi:hypothetical protein